MPVAPPALDEPDRPPPRLAWRFLAVALLVDFACLAVATFPAITSLTSKLPPWCDPLQHLWVMRWSRQCLLQGRLPYHAPSIQYPTGASLGNFSPLHLQTIGYSILSSVTQNDILIYNLLWISAFLFTALGTTILANRLTADRTCALFAGIIAMLSTPMLLHGHGHLELITLGAFPLFLVSWMALMDRPSGRALGRAAAWYLVLSMSAAYYAIFGAIPAALYLVAQAVEARRERSGPYLRPRAKWLLAFCAIALPALVVLFSSQIWAIVQGEPVVRPRSEFFRYGAPLWSYFIPTQFHLLSNVMPFDIYGAAHRGEILVEVGSYLGIVTLVLLNYAALHGLAIPRARFWWVLLGLLVLMSMGSQIFLGTHRIDLPDSWLWKYVFAFRMIRVPARFNLFVSVIAAVIAAAGLKHLLGRIGPRWKRSVAFAAVLVLAVADLAMVPFPKLAAPRMPACYEAILGEDPDATFLEVPQQNSIACEPVNSACGYWQALHGGQTTAGYSGRSNVNYDEQIYATSPFSIAVLMDPAYLIDPRCSSYGVVQGASFDDYAWLYVNALGLKYIVLHQWPGALPQPLKSVDRLKARLREAKIWEDRATVVFESGRLPGPERPTLLCAEGWHPRTGWPGPPTALVSQTAAVKVYNPAPSWTIRLTWEGEAFRRRRAVRVLADGREVASWQVDPGATRAYASPPFQIPGGIQSLTIASDSADQPTKRKDAIAEGDRRPYSLVVHRVSLEWAEPAVARAAERLSK